MAKKKVIIPQLTPDMTEAVLVAWEKKPGETIKPGDVLYEVETDKVVSQVESSVGGVMIGRLVEEGDVVKVGDPVAEIETEA